MSQDYAKRESARLDVQHRVFVQNIGYVLHPNIESSLPPNPRIGDVGCGTGVFLVDLDKSLNGHCQLDGFDITNAQFPSPDSTPKNMSFTLHDATQPWPPEYHGQYDVVVLRVLAGRLAREAWTAIARNVLTILKPGGALQWLEPNINQTAVVLRGRVDSTVSALRQRLEELKAERPGQFNEEFSLIPQTLASVGFEVEVRDVASSDRLPETREVYTKAMVEANITMLTKRLHEIEHSSYSLEQIEELSTKLGRDVDSGAYVRLDLHTIVARRPSHS